MKAGSAQAESCCVYVKPEKIMQHMYGIIPYLFDCWADPVAHLLAVIITGRWKFFPLELHPDQRGQISRETSHVEYRPLATLCSSMGSKACQIFQLKVATDSCNDCPHRRICAKIDQQLHSLHVVTFCLCTAPSLSSLVHC